MEAAGGKKTTQGKVMAQFIPTDTLFNKQWYLLNTGQTGFGPGNIDLGVTYVWPDYTGKGVKVAVFDDGVDFNHVDLVANYNHALDAIIDGSPVDAGPLTPAQVGGTTGFNSLNAHGTTIAGVIAAASNGVGTVGVAFDSQIVGVYAPVTGVRGNTTQSSQLIQAMQQLKNYDVADFAAGGSQFLDGQGSANLATFYTAIQSAVTDGRGGLGTILVNAMHNSGPTYGGVDGNSSGFDANRFYIHVGGVWDTGDVAQFTTRGSNMLVSGFTQTGAVGSGSARGIWTTDITGADGIVPGDWVDSGGTSLAGPQIAGIAALMLQANPNLGWRDVQTIFSLSARHTGSAIGAPTLDPTETDPWEFNGGDNWNGGGRHYSIDYGYGIANAHDAVRMAESWFLTGSAAATSANQSSPTTSISSGGLAIPDNTGSSVTLHFNVTSNIRVEEVRLNLGVNHPRIQDLTITLISPDGTTSKVFNPVSSEAGSGNNVPTGWAFLSEEFRGELSQGDWQVVITDHVSGNTGTLGNSSLQVFGSSNLTNSRYTYTDEFAQYGSLSGRGTLTDTDAGNDTINAAAVTSNSTLNLNAGATSTIAGKSVTIAVGSSIENAIGGDGNDTLTGNALDNILAGGRGTNTLDGGDGNDTAAFLYSHDKYVIQRVANTIVVTGSESTDTLTNIEHLKFSDITLDSTNLFFPQITSNGGGSTAAASVAENTTSVTTVTATDQDPGTTLSYSIVGGADQGLFQINSATGALSFVTAPDYENPSDADHNNSYIVTVRVSDGTLTSDQALTVNVTDVSEAPPNVVWGGSPDLGSRGPAFKVAGIGDFDGDGTSDVLWRNPTTGQVDTWRLVNGNWAASTDLGSRGTDWNVAGTGDFNHDGTSDVLWRNTTTGQVDVWLMSKGNWSSSVDLGSRGLDWQIAGAGDFNHDGTTDVLWRNTTTGQIDEWTMANGNWAGSTDLGSHGTSWQVAGTGDFNHDGTTDVLFRNTLTGQVDEWVMSNGNWSNSVDLGLRPLNWQVAAVNDFNADGTADVLWRNQTTGENDGWSMFNGQWFGSIALGPLDPAYQVAGTGDFNHSGSGDVLWHNATTGQVAGWLLGPG